MNYTNKNNINEKYYNEYLYNNCVKHTCNENGCSNNNDKHDCEKQDKCCNGEICTLDPSKVKCICTYMDIIYSEETVNGSPIFYNIDTSQDSQFSVKAEYKPLDYHCCTPCIVDTTSQFELESVDVAFKNFQLIGPLNTNSVLINGVAIDATLQSNGLSAYIPNSYLNEDCLNKDKGTKISVLLNALASWNFVAKIDLCGKVTTNSTVCKFKISFLNEDISLSNMSTFVAQDVCIPNIDSTLLNVRFDATSQLIDPLLTAVLSDPTDPTSNVILKLTGNMIINPIANLQILYNSKVCFNAMI